MPLPWNLGAPATGHLGVIGGPGGQVPGWALASAGLSPVLVTGAWLAAGVLQPPSYDPVRDTISAMAGRAGTDPWVMASALLAVGVCYFLTAAGLAGLRAPARVLLAVAGLSGIGIAVSPEPVTGSTLGFYPLYPLVIRGLASLGLPPLAAALITSFTGGLTAAVLVQRLATIWWGQQTARRAVAVFCLFPGSIVFSMAYSEGLTLPLVLGCLLALWSGRWLAAGLLAGLAGAVEPAGLALFPVTVAVAAREIRPFGLKERSARRSLLAPLLAPAGLAAFAVYLWYRTGTPFAAYQAQRYGWHEGDVVALLHQPIARRLFEHPVAILGHLLNLSLWNGLLGSAFLLCALLALARVSHELTPGVLIWTIAMGVLTLWSVMTLANARMLLIAFPAVIVWARALPGRRFGWFLAVKITLFLIASGFTLAGLMTP